MGITDIVTYHPFKGLWALCAILFNAAKLPLWMLWYLPPGLRQHPKYTYKQALRTQILKTLLWHMSFLRIYTPMILKRTTKEGDNLVVIPPSDKSDLYTGICVDKEIKPSTICAHWYPSPYDASTDVGKKIILHLHGGAYVIGDCRPADAGYAGGVLAKNIAKNLQVAYRLSSNPGGRFPAALQDAVTAYQFLLDKGIPASDILISGDSAGGNLAIALLRYIATTSGVVPDPGAALLWSPWVDIAAGLDPDAIDNSRNSSTDYLCSVFGRWGATAYAPEGGAVDVRGEWVSPKAYPFRTNTPVWVQSCAQEVLVDQDNEFYEAMKGVEGNKVAWHLVEVGNHDILLTGSTTGFDKEAQEAAAAAKTWLQSL